MAKLTFTPDGLTEVCKELRKKTKFSVGFDKMTPEAAETWLSINGEELCHKLNSGKYKVSPAVGFNVAKADGKYRSLAKLTVLDCIIQKCTCAKLSEICKAAFSEYSFAYQSGKGTGEALNLFCKYATSNYYVAEIDIKSFFDSINHEVLEKALYKVFFDRKTVNLLMSFAKMPVIIDGRLTDRSRGILQGSPISGMLCNVYLNSLDTELETKGMKFIRYADDIVIFGEKESEVREYAAFCNKYISETLRLKVSEGKCQISPSEKATFLGHKFLRDKQGNVFLNSAGCTAAAYYDWHTAKPLNQRRGVDILSDGILRQKDYSAVFDSETGKQNIPLDNIERINIFSNVIFDTGFLEKAANSGIYINVFGRDYSFKGRFTPFVSLKNEALIFEQLTVYNNKEKRLSVAKEFNLASVHNLRLNIRYHQKQNENDVYSRALKLIDKLYIKMKECQSYEDLLLIEAQTRGVYYSCFDSFIKNKDFVFSTRSKRPPVNEVNSLISFGNVVLYNYIATEIYKSSLDIRVGYLHATNRRAESLNLDIAEIFKPLIIDRVVFSLINRNEIRINHFEEYGDGGIYLNEDGKRIFLRAFYEKLNSTQQIDEVNVSYAAIIKAEIQKLTRLFRNGEKYKAFRQVR